ncbi:ABC transporter permease [Vallitalea okinawensis]|uniref:ABC transporter permease n=1 Tax=Vallitalea okinawensis TaxID=2078660 RepID=UPI000CFB59B1|nr:ABC transporter permease subunit [Vallitalea okinawensis]
MKGEVKSITTKVKAQNSFGVRAKKDFIRNRSLYLMVLPVIAYFIIFKYIPMYGASIAFKNYSPGLGIMGSPWIGLDHFVRFFNSVSFWRVLKNTFLLSLYSLLWGFPAPIILALLLNELKVKRFKNSVQTITYLPHFISLVVIIGLLKDFSITDGLFNDIIVLLGGERMPLLQKPEFFRTLYISSGIWQEIGWGSIIYLAALAGIDEQLYEAAMIDGANRWKQTLHVTLPGISSTIVILLILRIGRLLSVGFEKIILMYNPATYEVADVISTYVYRVGLLEFSWSYSTAIGLFNSVLNFTLLIAANKISKKFSESSLW